MKIRKSFLVLILGLAAAGTYLAYRQPTPDTRDEVTAEARQDDAMLLDQVKAMLAAHRKIIVLMSDEKSLDDQTRDAVRKAGHALFHENLARIRTAEERISALLARKDADRLAALEPILGYIETDPGLFDADRLAFRELLHHLSQEVGKDGRLPAVKMHKRLTEDIEALAEIQRQYDKEIQEIFSQFTPRAIPLKRERWEDYLAHLKTLYNRAGILKEQGIILSTTSSAKPAVKDEVIYGRDLPPKTLVLTFDDGPHATYTGEIAAILRQYGLPAIFFEVGNNLGALDKHGHAQLVTRAHAARDLLKDGHLLANHSLTHAKLSALSGDKLRSEVLATDSLLRAVDSQRANLFRFPYGASSAEGMNILGEARLRSMMWNIDSLDWADPVPRSIADRVMRQVDAQGRGILLFHDIHERTVNALPLVLGRLMAEGYQFATWDGTGFKLAKPSYVQGKPSEPVSGEFGQSWALVIGIDDYVHWPKLRHATKDAHAIGRALVEKYGFSPERVITLKDAEATRNGILAAFHERLQQALKPQDRVVVFFAGHGATMRLSSGRDLGYIIPVDSRPNAIASDAIPMTELQNIAESLRARHVLFLMDACYSGLGLARGASGFLQQNARRLGRQMLTAGGADQMVADNGPAGHSIFTWTLLQGLEGRADLNNDGFITATELAAYVSPTVASVSSQTPAFGSLPGSEGGDFVFETPVRGEYLDAQSTQLSGEAIALNQKLDRIRPETEAKGGTVSVPDLQGDSKNIVLPKAVPASQRQLAQIANDRGLRLYREKRYAEAEVAFTEALKQRPDFALAANNLGFIYYRQHKFAEAARWFEKAIELDRSRAVAYLNLGDAWRDAGEKEPARKAYRTYLELAGNGPGAERVRQSLKGL